MIEGSKLANTQLLQLALLPRPFDIVHLYKELI
jgi:hypothetical protein